jgi:hypothetical protein
MIFTERELEALSQARIAVFEGRLILDAQPPIDEASLAAVAARCAGTVPAELVALWRTAFGGRLEYDLTAEFQGGPARLSFTELFFPGSEGYHDLWGWIDHQEELEKEAAQERRERWSGVGALPFGGFEYLDRLHALVAPGNGYGSVVAWTQGLPPAWTFRLNEASETTIASDVRALFQRLMLEKDPATDGDPTGVALLEAIDDVAGLGAMGRSAAEKLRSLVQSAVVDWRSALSEGSIAAQPVLRRLALEHAASNDDLELLEQLSRLGCDLSERLSAQAGALEYALSTSSHRVSRFLLDRGASVVGALRHGAGAVDPELARELLRRGATVDEHAVFAAVDAGRGDTAAVLLEAAGKASSLRMAIRARERAFDADAAAKRVESGELVSSVPAEEHRRRVELLRTLASQVDPTLRRR